MKGKLKTANDFIISSDKFRFDKFGGLVSSLDDIEISSKQLHKLGTTIDVEIHEDGCFVDNDDAIWPRMMFEDLVEEESKPAIQQYDLEKDFAYFLSEVGHLYFVEKESEDFKSYSGTTFFREITLS